MAMTTPCRHDEWTANLTRYRDTDDDGNVTGWSIDLRARCADCGAPVLWPGSAPGELLTVACAMGER